MSRLQVAKIVAILLNGQGGELDRCPVIFNADMSDDMSDAIHDAIAGWILSVGDTIKIVEVDE